MARSLPPIGTACIDALRQVVGAGNVLTDAALVAPFSVDWTGRYSGSTPAVVRPGSVDEVAGVLATCLAHNVAWVPQGGNTGLVGGGVPVDGEVVVSTSRLTALGTVDRDARQVSVGAGVTLAQLQRHVAPDGLRLGIDFGARDRATIGAMVATNAGGNAVLRFGMMGEQVTGIEAVLPDGQVIRRLSGLPKDNTGYDLTQLLCGSEGTLGVITAVRVRLVPAATHVTTVALGVAAIADALRLLAELRSVDGLEACELMRSVDIATLCAARGWSHPPPWEAPWAVLAEACGPGSFDELGAAVERSASLLIGDPAVADRPGVRELWWAIRDAQGDIVRAFGAALKLDVSVPHMELERFVDDLAAVVASHAPDARLVVFGHLGDANVHVNVGTEAARFDALEDAILRLVLKTGGSVSAEHGIGRAKRSWLTADRGAVAVAAMRAVKTAWDPAGLANPNVLFDR